MTNIRYAVVVVVVVAMVVRTGRDGTGRDKTNI